MKKNRLLLFAIVALVMAASCDSSEEDFEKAKKVNTLDAYTSFVLSHPHAELADEARDSIIAIYRKRQNIERIPDTHKDYRLANRLKGLIDERVDEEYQAAVAQNTIEGWENYINCVPKGYARDAYSQIAALKKKAAEEAEEARWKTEADAWKTASEYATIAALNKYLDLYPNGRHAKQAERKLIDLEVESVFAGEHGILPPMDRGYSTGTSYSEVEVENRTQYTLTVNYSGPDSKRMVISPYATKSIRIGNGGYRVAASVGHGVIPFAGTEYLDGSQYRSSFYIQTRRY